MVLHHFGSKEALRERVDEDVVATVDGLFARIVPDRDGDEIAYGTWLANFPRLFQEHPYVTAHIGRSLLEDFQAGAPSGTDGRTVALPLLHATGEPVGRCLVAGRAEVAVDAHRHGRG